MSVMKLERNEFQRENIGIYGKISKYAVSDTALSCDAKALYGLLCTYSVFGNAITAGNKTLCKYLNIGAKKIYKLLFELSTQGYIEIIKGKFSRSNYKIAVCPEKYLLDPADAKDIYAYEKIRTVGIQAYGYGLIEQRVLKDPALHITAKAIYAYFCAFSGNTSTAYPSVKAILRDLKICESTYYKYIRQLVDKGYVEVIEHKTQNGRYSPNEYKLTGHPNARKPSNYEKNIAAVNKQMQGCKTARNQSSPSPKSDTRDENKKGLDFSPGTPSEPCPTKPSAKIPSTIFDLTYNKNNIKTNRQNKNTLNQAQEKSKNLGNINQSTKSDSIDKTNFENFSVNPNKIEQDLRKYKGIHESYLKNKASLKFIVKTLSDNAETSKPKTIFSKSQEEFFKRQGIIIDDAPKSENKLQELFLKCLVDMLHDSGNPNKKYAPEEIAGFINSHIKINDGAASFDNWLEKFEKSFMQSVGKPAVASNIKNPYAYVKVSLWKFLATYDNFHCDFKTSSESEQSLFDTEIFFNKIVKNSMKL